jgi:tripartite-type tricarboxylate transporter receptor subunit TctC
MTVNKSALSGAAALMLLLVPMCAAAQQPAPGYPSRAVRFIVPYTPGGLGDSFARSLAEYLTEHLGQPVVVDNRPGASQALGADATAKSPADGYTIFMGTQSGMVINTIATRKLPYDPVRDFSPISMLFTSPLYLAVHPSVPANSVKELVTLAKAQPGKLSFASIGRGTIPFLSAEMLKSQAGIDILHVPYKGSAPAMADLVAGRVSMMFDGAVSLLPQVRAGKLRALASTGSERTEAMPDLPTIKESGFADFDVTAWFGLLAPAGVPRPIVDRLNREVVTMLKLPATRVRFVNAGIQLTPSTPEQLGARIVADLPIWTRVMRAAGIEPE